MKVASIVLNNFKHDNRVLKECISLQNHGYEVKVLAYLDEGQKEHDIVSGIEVHRIRLTSKKWSRNRVLQIFKFMEFAIRIVRLYKDFDIYHCNDLNALPIGIIVKLFANRNAKVVYDAHEHETERNGLSGSEKYILKVLERILIRSIDAFITVSKGIADDYKRLYKINPTLVLNCPIYQSNARSNLLRERLKISSESMIFLYQGSITFGRGVESTIEAFKSFSDQAKVIVFLGYGPNLDLVKDAAGTCDNIFYHEAVSMEELIAYTSSADVGLSLIENTCLSYNYSLPNKFFEYIMAGIPIIATDLFEMGRIVRAEKIGYLIENNSANCIKQVIDKISIKDLDSYSEQLKQASLKYCWSNQEEALISTYTSLENTN